VPRARCSPRRCAGRDGRRWSRRDSGWAVSPHAHLQRGGSGQRTV